MWFVQEKNNLVNVIICNGMRRQVFGFAIGIGIGIDKGISQNVCFGNSHILWRQSIIGQCSTKLANTKKSQKISKIINVVL